MPTPDPQAQIWEARIREGDRTALAALYSAHRDRLRRWVEYRIDPRMQGRVSASDILQEIYLAAEQRLEHFRELPEMPFSVWVRLLANQRLVDVHRRHLGVEARDAGREVTINTAFPTSSAAHIAGQLAGDLTSPSEAAVRHEVSELLVRKIEAMDPLDREILALRHFDELSNDEVSQLLGISRNTASKRYVRALGRLRTILGQVPGLIDETL
jgi:RNA polymerase sigma-70 factor (ECF subfamily)